MRTILPQFDFKQTRAIDQADKACFTWAAQLAFRNETKSKKRAIAPNGEESKRIIFQVPAFGLASCDIGFYLMDDNSIESIF